MKKRLLSLVLAASMMFSSVAVYANETEAVVGDGAVIEAAADETASGDAIDVSGDSSSVSDSDAVNASGTKGPAYLAEQASEPWQATVFGDVGGQDRIDLINVPDDTSGNSAYANGKPIYNVAETVDGKSRSVQMNMGVPSENVSQGKVAGSTEGMVYYYRELNADDDFTLSATAHVNAVLTNNDQISFGINYRDNMQAGVNYKSDYGDSVYAAPLRFAEKNNGTADVATAFYRAGGKLNYDSYRNADTALPVEGQDIPVKLKKSGNIFTLTYGNVTQVVDGEAAGLVFSDSVYAGLFVARCADITFSNIKLSIVGEPVEIGDWETAGNGLCGKTLENSGEDRTKKLSVDEHSDDNKSIKLAIADHTEGKFSNTEDSYFYRAAQAPAGEDFTLKTSVKLSIAPNGVSDGNNNQRGSGVIVFDKHYVKEPNDAYADLAGISANSLYIGLYSPSKGSTDVNFGYRVKQGTSTPKFVPIFDTLGSIDNTYAFDLMVKRSGDNIKIKTTYNGETKTIDLIGADLYDGGLDSFFSNNQYIGYAVGRIGSVEATNNDLSVGTKAVKSISIATMPNKSSYYSTETVDMTGTSLNVVYKDGSTDVIDSFDEISFTGYDVTDNGKNSFTNVGTRTVKASIGAASVEIPIEVRPIKVTDLKLTYAPVKNEAYTGSLFNDTGIVVEATFENGSTKTLSASERQYTIDGTLFDNATYITDEFAGEKTVKVDFLCDSNTDINGQSVSYPLNIKKATLNEIRITSFPAKTTFYVGDELDTAGLSLVANYTITDGDSTEVKNVLLKDDEWEVTGFDSSAATIPNQQTLTITYKKDPTKTATYSIYVVDVQETGIEVATYPRLTYAVGEAFDPSDLSLNLVYNSGKKESIDRPVYYIFNGTDYTTSNGEVVDEATAKAAGAYYIDLTSYNNSAVGSTTIDVVGKGKGTVESTITLTATIEEAKDYGWKASIFGASSLGVGETDPSSYITVTDNDGNELTNDKDKKQIGSYQMSNGSIDGVQKVDVVSWAGSGKVSGDQDGIAYFYTKVNANQNFKLTGDITVNRYVKDPNQADHRSDIDKKMASDGVSELDAIDRLRSGQECFGIMARDVIPYAGGLSNDGNDSANSLHIYQGGVNNHMTTDPNKALKDENGNPLDIYEAFKSNSKVQEYYVDEDGVKHTDFYYTDAEGNVLPYQKDADGNVVPYDEDADHVKHSLYSYNVTKKDVENTFASNIVIAGGCTDSTFPTDPTVSSYYRKSIMNRINIMIRRGVTATDGGGERVGITSTTNAMPKAGDKYTITLQKLNDGFAITTVDHINGTTKTAYASNSELLTEGVLQKQDADNLYVGFFASRWADISVENIHLYEIDPATDKVSIPYSTEIYSPKVTVSSPLFATSENYTLVAKASNPSGGTVNISLNGELVWQDLKIGNKSTFYNLKLNKNSANDLTIAFTPSTADNCASYDTVVTRYVITEKEIDSVKTMYVAPNGSTLGDGTRENPIDLETAIGLSEPGSTIIMLDGVYNLRSDDKLGFAATNSGSAINRKTLKAENSGKAIIDLEGKNQGIECSASYWTFEGFEITNSGPNMKPFHIGGNNNIVRGVTSHDNQDGGIQISRISSDQYDITLWPSNNLIVDCEAYNNCDPAKQNADGFAAKLTVGYGNVFKDCISHHNLDDGWDCYTKLATGAIGSVTLEDCITYRQTFRVNEDGSEESYNSATASGNGFKLGGENIYVMHYLKGCKTFNNPANGVDSNNNPAMKLRNIISYGNGANYGLYSGTGRTLVDANGSQRDANGKSYKFDYDMKGCISSNGGANDSIGSVNDGRTADTDKAGLGLYFTEYGNVSDNPILSESNYFKWGEKDSNNKVIDSENVNHEQLDPSTFFVSTNMSDSLGDNYRYSRKEDGTFEHGPFLARAVEYVYDESDKVTYPDEPTETTQGTTNGSETTTNASTPVSGGGGGGGSIVTTTTTTTTETTTEATTAEVVSKEETTEATTVDLRTAINPPKANGEAIDFTDLKNVAWAKDAINNLAKAGIISGTSATTYNPSASTKRADFIVALVNALGLESNSTDNFSDVPADAYYAKAVATAKAYGIASGLGDGTFNPTATISRQDMMVIIARTYEMLGVELDKSEDALAKFTDADKISAYAVPYVAALVNKAVVSGDDNSRVNPLANVTRAEMAILMNAVYAEAVAIESEAVETTTVAETTTEATTAEVEE